MATQLSKAVNEATDQVVEIIDQAQEATASVVRSVSEAVSEYVPAIGIGESLLTPGDAVETSFGVGSKFMNAGRSAALGLVEAVAPITDKLFGTKKTAPKSVSKSA